MFLVTKTTTTTRLDPETGEPIAETRNQAHIETDEETVTRLLAAKKAGDERLQDHRVYRLQIDDRGKPTVTSEKRT